MGIDTADAEGIDADSLGTVRRPWLNLHRDVQLAGLEWD